MDQEEVLTDEHDLTDEEIVNVLKQGYKRTGKVSQFTRRQLMQRSNWEGEKGWKASKWKQLYEMDMDNMHGAPVFPPKGATILQTIRTYLEKPDKKKFRNCCNGSQLKRQKQKSQKSPLPYYQSYAACAS